MEKRQTPLRRRTLKGARIVFNQNFSTYDCLVRNLTNDGAKLETENTASVPDEFTLRLDDGALERKCAVKWRKGNTMGVEFQD